MTGLVGWPSPAVGPEQAVDDRAEMAGGHRVEGSGAGQLPELRGGAEVTSGRYPTVHKPAQRGFDLRRRPARCAWGAERRR